MLAISADWEVSSDRASCLAGLWNKQKPAKPHLTGLQHQRDTAREVLGSWGQREVLEKVCRALDVFVLDQ